jgi:hypothetical protein
VITRLLLFLLRLSGQRMAAKWRVLNQMIGGLDRPAPLHYELLFLRPIRAALRLVELQQLSVGVLDRQRRGAQLQVEDTVGRY